MNLSPPDVKSIFGRAMEIASPTSRAAYLDEACGTDAGLRAEVEALIKCLGRAGEFMGQPAAGEATEDFDHISEQPGTVIGPYKLMEQIGEGGMGLVFVAEQQQPGTPQGRAEDHQAGHGHARRHRPVRGRAAGPGADGPPQHRPGPRRRHDGQRPALLRDGAGQGHPDHRVLRRAAAHDPRAAGPVSLGLPGGPACPRQGHHPPRPEAVEHPGRPARRRAGGQGDRLRRRQGDRPAADRQDDLHAVRADDRHAAVHEPRAGGDQRAGRGHSQRRLQPGRAPVRVADRHDAVRPRSGSRPRPTTRFAGSSRRRSRRGRARG